jgi:hypothetical protein
MTALTLSLLFLTAAPAQATDKAKYFTITVEDADTGRGVPLVELQTVNNIRHYTDSNGVVAFHEPGLMSRRVFFTVKSHGYDFPKDGFGFRGVALDVNEGGIARLKIKRLIVAERLYRITGAGIYRDSVLVGRPVPIKQPLLNGQVLGSDSVVNAVYRGKYYWFWGDTNKAGYPLGNFQATGATSELPGKGGIDPSAGVDLTYFVGKDGFARAMTAIPGDGPTWLDALITLPDDSGRERLYAGYVKIRPPMEAYARGLAVFDDDKQRFERVAEFDLKAPVHPFGHPFKHTDAGVDYIYFGNPFPLVRVRADARHLRNVSNYEAYTCLRKGSRLDRPQPDRAADGSLRYGWKTNTPTVGPKEQADLIKKGVLKPEEALLQLRDVETGKPVLAASGSVCWNPYRKRWVMIAVQAFGTSFLGEVWYAEADTPLGPWVYARKVVTHDKYSFYNPRQHPLFDQQGGRQIYFEGTYTHTFSGNPEATPRYDYNQIMYRLDLNDSRLVLPVPVYWSAASGESSPFRTGQVSAKKADQKLVFFALDRPRPGTVPVYPEFHEKGGWSLRVGKPGSGEPTAPVFHVLAREIDNAPATTVPLYEYVHADGMRREYTTDASWSGPGFRRVREPFCRVWGNPGPIQSRPRQHTEDPKSSGS